MAERWGMDPYEGYQLLNVSDATADPVPCPSNPSALIWLRDFQDPMSGACVPSSCEHVTALGALTMPCADSTSKFYLMICMHAGVIPWNVLIVMGLISLLMVGLLVYGWHQLQKWRLLPSLFVPQRVEVVHYDLVQLPVDVVCERLDMEWMWGALPVHAEFVQDLPVGE